MAAHHEETVLSVHHWTDRLFSFTTTRDLGFRFNNGQFTMLGLMIHGKLLQRAYSIASANHADHLEFLSIKVEGGPLTSQLRSISAGDRLVIGRKTTGTLVLDYLLPGKRLYLLATGTGLAPFLAIIRDPATYEQFEQVILVHGVRWVAELAYHDYITRDLLDDEFLGDFARRQLLYYPTVTREPFRNQGRVTTAIHDGTLRTVLNVPDLDSAHDRIMVCGNPEMLMETAQLLKERDFAEGNTSIPGTYVIERAFVEK